MLRSLYAVKLHRTMSIKAHCISDCWQKRVPSETEGRACTQLPSARMLSEGTVVGLCVCLSVTQHLTSRMFVPLTNDTTYLTGNEGQEICAVLSENALLQS